MVRNNTMASILEQWEKSAIGFFNPYLKVFAIGEGAEAVVMGYIDKHYLGKMGNKKTATSVAETAKRLTAAVFDESAISGLKGEGYRDITSNGRR